MANNSERLIGWNQADSDARADARARKNIVAQRRMTPKEKIDKARKEIEYIDNEIKRLEEVKLKQEELIMRLI